MLLRDHLRRVFHASSKSMFYALKNVSFEVARGEGLAIVGRNGAGKSTLLSLVAALAPPTSGHISVNGRVAALLELGSGFHPDLTGAENVLLNASLIGLGRRRTAELFDEIVDFSGLHEVMEEPLRTYSTGMAMRLAFSVAINMDPDILLTDEVLAVGDQQFQAKCFERILQFRARGKTVMCVSHGPSLLRPLCDRAIWLDEGQIVMAGEIGEVLDAYAGQSLPVNPAADDAQRASGTG